MNAAVVIPARFRSTRFPGKPLAEIAGRSMLWRVWDRCRQAVPADRVFVATDDDRIEAHAAEEGIRSIRTSPTCLTGTDRVAEASAAIDADIIVNVQGDEPLVDPGAITRVLEAAAAHPVAVINAMSEIHDEVDFRSSSVPKVAAAPDGKLLYMSRGAIPTDKELSLRRAWRQVCIYAFPPAALEAFADRSAKTPLEEIEDIEILRFLELGLDVRMVEVARGSVAVDHPEDIARVEAILQHESDTAPK